MEAGRLGEVWKHLVLAEVVRADRPLRYAESHAGRATHLLAQGGETRYGIRHTATTYPRPSAYLDVARPYLTDGTLPGSVAVALSIAPSAATLLADDDPDVVADLRGWLARSPATRARAVAAEGTTALGPWLAEGRALVHVDPDDPEDEVDDDGGTALDFAASVADAGHGLVFWYGYDVPEDRAWALPALDLPDLVAVDLQVTTAHGEVDDDGDLRAATTPGTGFGVVLAGLDPMLARRVEALGEALLAGYDGAPLPDGTPGALDLLVDLS